MFTRVQFTDRLKDELQKAILNTVGCLDIRVTRGPYNGHDDFQIFSADSDPDEIYDHIAAAREWYADIYEEVDGCAYFTDCAVTSWEQHRTNE